MKSVLRKFATKFTVPVRLIKKLQAIKEKELQNIALKSKNTITSSSTPSVSQIEQITQPAYTSLERSVEASPMCHQYGNVIINQPQITITGTTIQQVNNIPIQQQIIQRYMQQGSKQKRPTELSWINQFLDSFGQVDTNLLQQQFIQPRTIQLQPISLNLDFSPTTSRSYERQSSTQSTVDQQNLYITNSKGLLPEETSEIDKFLILNDEQWPIDILETNTFL